jgi:hypothetical protein
MINAGFPFRDNAIWPETFQTPWRIPAPSYLLTFNDLDLCRGKRAIPVSRGWLKEYESKYQTKTSDVLVPAQETMDR